jgi:hypothetical protein
MPARPYRASVRRVSRLTLISMVLLALANPLPSSLMKGSSSFFRTLGRK